MFKNLVRVGICATALGLCAAALMAQSLQTANQNQAPVAPALGTANAAQHMQNVQEGKKDIPAELYNATVKLKSAREDLTKAGGEWGGHKANAMAKIDEALRELQIAADWARSHGTY